MYDVYRKMISYHKNIFLIGHELSCKQFYVLTHKHISFVSLKLFGICHTYIQQPILYMNKHFLHIYILLIQFYVCNFRKLAFPNDFKMNIGKKKAEFVFIFIDVNWRKWWNIFQPNARLKLIGEILHIFHNNGLTYTHK